MPQRIGMRPVPCSIRRQLIEDVPDIPAFSAMKEESSDDEQASSSSSLMFDHGGYPNADQTAKGALPCGDTRLTSTAALATFEQLEVAGSWGYATYPALSPRSGLMKRKDGDYLFLNGLYSLCTEFHNGAPCWEKTDTATVPARVIFRAADGLSWVIDECAQAGDIDDLVCARLWTTELDFTKSLESWAPVDLCVHPAGVNCAGACLIAKQRRSMGSAMTQCC